MEKPTAVVGFEDWHAYKVCLEMRQDEIEQYLALTYADEYDHQVAARSFVNMPGMKFSLVDAEYSPYCIGGFHEVIPGVFQSWMAGTEEGWRKHWRTITKGSLWLQEKMFEHGARRVQTTALASRVQAIEWYERSLNLVYEGTWEQFGRNDEDVASYAMTRRRFYGIEQ